MRKLHTVAMFLGLVLTGQAQNIINVQFDPNPIHECEFVTVTMNGNYPSNNYTFGFYTFDNVNFVFTYYATGTGSSPQTAFSEFFPPLGPWDAGTYTFTANLVLNGTLVDTWSTPLTVLPAPNYDPGVSTYGNQVCPSGPAIPLLSFLDGTPDPSGDWVDPFGSAHGPNFVPGVDPPGFYTYQWLLQPPCVPIGSEVQIEYLPSNDPGLSSTFAICQTGAAVNLFDSLQGTPYSPGTWTAPGGGSFSGSYDPDLNNPGIYTYTVPPIAPCTLGTSATITVTEAPLSNAGIGGTVEVCDYDTSLVLNSVLTGSPQQTGTWDDPFGILFGDWAVVYNATNPNHEPGTYVYTMISANCPADTAMVTVVEVAPPCTIGFDENEGATHVFDLVPNPSHGEVLTEVELIDGSLEHWMEVLNVNGQVVHSERLALPGTTHIRRTLDLGDLPRGAYLVRLRNASGSSARRLMLQ